MGCIRLELLQFSYWEHFKVAKEISLVYPIDHPRRRKIEEGLDKLQGEIRLCKEKGLSE